MGDGSEQSGEPPSEGPPPTGGAPPAGDDEGDEPERHAFAVRIGTRRAWQRIEWGALTVGAIALAVWLAVIVPAVSTPLLLAFIFAYLLDPPVRFLARRGVSRTLAAAVAPLLLVLLLVGLGFLVGPRIVAELEDVPALASSGVERVTAFIDERTEWDAQELRERLIELGKQLFASPTAQAAAADTARTLLGGAKGVLAVAIGLLMTLIFAFFMLRDYQRVLTAAHGMLPPRYRPYVVARAREVDKAMSSFLRGQMLVATILAVLYVIGFLVVGQPLAFVVGVVSGLGNIIPFVGTAIGVVMATGLVLLQEPGWAQLLQTWAVFVAVQALESWIITPRVVGRSVDLSPFGVIVAVLVFGELFGFVGVLIAVPLAAVLKILGRSVVAQYRESVFFRETA